MRRRARLALDNDLNVIVFVEDGDDERLLLASKHLRKKAFKDLVESWFCQFLPLLVDQNVFLIDDPF